MAATDTNETTKEALEAVFSTRCVLYLRDATKEELLQVPRVEAGSNTSTVALRVVGGEENGTQCLGV
jgi:hypothetical protein